MIVVVLVTVAEPDLQIRWGGGAVSKKKIRPFRPQFGLKIAVGGGGVAPAGPSPGSATG